MTILSVKVDSYIPNIIASLITIYVKPIYINTTKVDYFKYISTIDTQSDFTQIYTNSFYANANKGIITGTVTTALGTSAIGYTILLRNRNNINYIKTTTTNSSGQYTFNNVPITSSAGYWYVIALDNSGSNLNAIINDYISV